MDINELFTLDAHEQGVEVRIKDQYGKDTDIYITVAGPDSKRYRKIQSNNMRELARAINGEDVEVPEDKDEIDLARITLGWRGAKNGKKDYEFTTENAVALYIQAPYIVNQLNRALHDRSNFIQHSAKK